MEMLWATTAVSVHSQTVVHLVEYNPIIVKSVVLVWYGKLHTDTIYSPKKVSGVFVSAGFCQICSNGETPFLCFTQSIAMDNFYAGEGTDHSGVPTKMVTLNCSLNLAVYNPASMFGIHVTSGPVRLLYSEIAIGVGQVCLSASLALFFL